jgi:hypothetical protein
LVDRQTGRNKKRPFLGDSFFVPNHSGNHDAGTILNEPTKDTNLINKKYVDDSIVTHTDNEDAHHNEIHTILSHDTDTTGAELTALADKSIVDNLHRHIKLATPDGSNDQALVMDNNARAILEGSEITLKGGASGFESGDTEALILRTGALGSAPFNQAGSLIYRPRIHTTPGRSSHIFYTGNPSLERMRINELGNIGIGTINPEERLHIEEGQILIKNPSNSILRFYRNDASIGSGNTIAQIRFGGLGGADNEGAAEIRAITPSSGASWNSLESPIDLVFITTQKNSLNPVERMRINSEGNVGIGTTTPTQPLSVKEKGGISDIGGNIIKLTNKTGSNSVAGQLVQGDTTQDNAFATSGANSDDTIGIVLEDGVSDGSETWIVISGIADVLMDAGGSTRGDRIISSATAGSADVWNVGGAVATHFQEIGHCIETRVGAGLAKIVLHFN